MTYDIAKLDEIVRALLHVNAFSDRGVTEQACDEEEPFLPVVNSPRTGVCGYRG